MEPPNRGDEAVTGKPSWLRRHKTHGLLGLIVICLLWLAVEWIRAPNGTVLLGPLYFVWYGQKDGWAFVILLFPCLFAYPAKPRLLTAAISMFAFMAWLILGVLGESIGC
jgi:hypothetical protein